MSLTKRGPRRLEFLTATTATFASVGFVKAPARAAQFEFKCASELATSHPSTIRLTEMWKAVEQESSGRLHVQFFPNSQLGGSPAMLSQTRLGAIQFHLANPGNLATVVPITDICYLGFAYSDAEEGMRIMSGPLFTYMQQEVAAKGLRLLPTVWDSGMNHIGSIAKPIRTPDDLKGFKIRVPESKIQIDLFKTLGANPAVITYAEIYTSLQTRLIDGEPAPLVTIYTGKFYEVQKYISLTNHAWSPNMLIANGDAWKSLPPDIQAIVERNGTKYATLEHNDTKSNAADTQAKLAAAGITFNTVNQAPFRPPLRPYYESWASTFGSNAWALLQGSLRQKLT